MVNAFLWKALELIETQAGLRYRKNYAGIWRKGIKKRLPDEDRFLAENRLVGPAFNLLTFHNVFIFPPQFFIMVWASPLTNLRRNHACSNFVSS
jgi:hypothetical protein